MYPQYSPAHLVPDQGACQGLHVQAGGGLRLFQGNCLSVYTPHSDTAVQGGDTEHAGAPQPPAPTSFTRPADYNPFSPPPPPDLSDIAEWLPPAPQSVYSRAAAEADWDAPARADKQFDLGATAGADEDGEEVDLDALHALLSDLMGGGDEPFAEGEIADLNPVPDFDGRHERLLKTVWGVYGYYRPARDGWRLNLKDNRQTSDFYRETMFF